MDPHIGSDCEIRFHLRSTVTSPARRLPVESAAQNARVLTEGWVEHALFCPKCGAQPMARFAANRPVAEFLCDACAEEYELKSQKARIGARVVDGAWATMQARLQAKNNPNLLVMRYDARRAAVTDLIVVPKPFFTPEVIERRRPLAASARRAGWVGCNILLGEVPDAGKVRLIREGVLTPQGRGHGQVPRDAVPAPRRRGRAGVADRGAEMRRGRRGRGGRLYPR